MASRSRGQAVFGELLGVARRTAQVPAGVATESGSGVSGNVAAGGRVWYSSLCDGVAQTSTTAGRVAGSTTVSSFGNGVQQVVRHFKRGIAPSFPRASPRLPGGAFPSTANVTHAPRAGGFVARNGKAVDGKVPLSRRIHVGEHPASSKVPVGGGICSKQVFRMYGIPLVLLGSAVGGKLAYDYYQEYAERHRLLKPWRGEMIKIEGVNALQAPPTTFRGKVVEGVMIAVRTAHLSILFIPLLVTAPLAFWYDTTGAWRERWNKLLLQTLMLAGPAFMKWGQWAAARPDLFPVDVCRELEALHMDAPTHPYSYTEAVVKDAFGHEIDQLFAEFDKEPIASGTIGQVYRAVLSPEGSALLAAEGQEPPPPNMVVALKIRHPGVQEAIRYDFTVMKLLTAAMNLVPSLEWLHLDEMTWQFETLLGAQVDFTVEGDRLAHFNHNFRKWNYVAFPKPIIAHPAALVETFEEGVGLTEYTRNEEDGSMMNRILAKLGLSVVLKMMLVDNLVHADLHPGNILVRDLPPFSLPVWESFWQDMYARLPFAEQFQKKIPQMVLVDAGMTATLTHTDSSHMVQFFHAVSKFDGVSMAKAMIDFSVNFPSELHERFSADIVALISAFDQSQQTNEWNSFSECLNTAMGCVRDYRLCIEGAVCTVIVTSMMLSDMQQRLDPECGVIPVLDKILLGRTIKNIIPSLEDSVEWLTGKHSVSV